MKPCHLIIVTALICCMTDGPKHVTEGSALSSEARLFLHKLSVWLVECTVIWVRFITEMILSCLVWFDYRRCTSSPVDVCHYYYYYVFWRFLFGINSSFPPLLRFSFIGKHVGLSSGFSSGIFIVTFWLAEVLGWLSVWNPLFYLWRGTVSSSYALCHCCVYWYDSHINGTSACKSLAAWRHRRSFTSADQEAGDEVCSCCTRLCRNWRHCFHDLAHFKTHERWRRKLILIRQYNTCRFSG